MFRPLGEVRPTMGAPSTASMTYDWGRQQTLLVTNCGKVELWAWRNTHWERQHDELFPDTYAGRPIVCWGLDDTHIFRACNEAIEWCRLSEPQTVHRLDAPKVRPAVRHGFAGYDDTQQRFALTLPIDSGSVTYTWDGESLDEITEGPNLTTGCWDHGRGRFIGMGIEGTTYQLRLGAWRVLDDQLQAAGSELTCTPWLGKVVRLIAHSDETMELYGLDEAWHPLDVYLPVSRPNALLSVDPEHRQIFCVGGQKGLDSGPYCDETWVSQQSKLFEQAPDGDATGRFATEPMTPVQMDDTLLVADHWTGSVERWDDGAWQQVLDPNVPLDHDVSQREPVAFAASDRRIFRLDKDGDLWSARPGGDWQRRAAARPGPDGRPGEAVAIGWDRPRRRLVSFGGPARNDTRVYDRSGWSSFDDELRPAPGVGAIATAPDETYLLAGADLWRLGERSWRCIGSDPSVDCRGLVFEPKRKLLFSFGTGWGEAGIFVWQSGGWRQVAVGPPRTAIRHFEAPDGATPAVAPAEDRLMLLDEDLNWSLDLGNLDLPAGEIAEESVEPNAATTPPPETHTRRSLAICPTEEPVGLAELSVDLMVPDGWRLIALAPSRPDSRFPGDFSGIAVLGATNIWESRHKPWRIGGGGLEVRFIHGAAPPLVIADPARPDGVLVRAEFEAFRDIDPSVADQHHPPDPRDIDRTDGSKLGGYPRYFRRPPSTFEQRSDLQFIGQLSGDLFPPLDGEFARAFLFASEEGKMEAFLQSE